MSTPPAPSTSSFVVTFTGTRDGLTLAQHRTLLDTLIEVRDQDRDPVPDNLILRHGAALGADSQAHVLAVGVGWQPWLYPTTYHQGVAWVLAPTAAEVFAPTEEHTHRNRVMLDGADMVIGCPAQPTVPGRYASGKAWGGTWSTIENATAAGLLTIVITPDGRSRVDQPPDPSTSASHVGRKV